LFLISFITTISLEYFVISNDETSLVDTKLPTFLNPKLKEIFIIRNNALLKNKTNTLNTIYYKDIRNGRWAYEHELKKLNYLHKWSEKQGVKFKNIDSHVIVKYVNKKKNLYRINLLVSTEYKYVYNDSPEIYNVFRIGTYHSLDLRKINEKWLVSREWYTDPFADSLYNDLINNNNLKKIILSGEEYIKQSTLNLKRIKALNYVDQYCGAASHPDFSFTYNTKYRNYNHLGGDCANFASQMLYEGGGFFKTRTWNYSNGSGSKAWVNAHAFNNYMTYSGRASLIARGSYNKVLKASYKLLPGDYIAYEKKGKVVHISVVTGRDSKGYVLVNSHNTDRYRVPWELGWSNSEMNFRLMRVNY
jgi:hypothetical protein